MGQYNLVRAPSTTTVHSRRSALIACCTAAASKPPFVSSQQHLGAKAVMRDFSTTRPWHLNEGSQQGNASLGSPKTDHCADATCIAFFTHCGTGTFGQGDLSEVA